MDYWREKISSSKISREDLAAWFGDGASSMCIFEIGEKVHPNSRQIRPSDSPVTEKDICNLFWRFDSDFSGEIDFWELEKMTQIRKKNQGGSIPIKC